MSNLKSNIHRPAPASRPTPAPPQRMGAQIQRASNSAMLNQAAQRREGQLQQTNQTNRVRPAVRPATPPRTVMPARPAPPV
ncbi:MAG: hypothetical protein HUU38_29730, partial [Anaerolineales bacterium]|nr:hypothetical protein [Anaerolineales bacterium]